MKSMTTMTTTPTTKTSFKNGIRLILFLITLIKFFSGCALAREHYTHAPFQEDRFLGFFVTFSEMGALPAHDYFNEDGRIYFTREEGERGYLSRLTVPIDGIPFFAGRYEGEHGMVHFGESGAGIVSEQGMHVHFTDYGTTMNLRGTLNVNPRLANMVYVLNSVYQTPCLQIYVRRGGSMISVARGSYFSEGQIQSLRVSHSASVTENGTTRTDTTSVELGIAVMHTPLATVFIEMDDAHNIIYIHEFEPAAVPFYLTLQDVTAYVIVETQRAHYASPPVQRSLVQPGGSVPVFYEMDNGVINRRIVHMR
jgi:hypothetical protein